MPAYCLDDGWLRGARACPSPNANARPDGVPVSLLVVHNISLPPGVFGGPYIDDLFCNRLDHDAHPYFDTLRGLQVSAHFLVRRDGEVVQYVPVGARAWHAGASSFGGRENCNDFSVGVELEGTDDVPYTDIQYRRLADIAAALVREFPAITAERIAGHADVAPGRKTDPGAAFDWPRFRTLLAQALAGGSDA